MNNLLDQILGRGLKVLSREIIPRDINQELDAFSDGVDEYLTMVRSKLLFSQIYFAQANYSPQEIFQINTLQIN